MLGLQACLVGQRRLPALLRGAHYEPVLRLGGVILALGPLDLVARPLQPLPSLPVQGRALQFEILAYLSLGLDQHNIALHAAPRPGLRSIGLQVSRNVLLEDLAKRLRGAGLAVEAMTDARPGVRAVLEVQVGGHSFQLFQAMDTPAPGFGAAGIVPNRIGHLAVITPGAAELLQFLTGELGFWKTDWFQEQVTFVACNRDHHVLNVIEAPVTATHHVAFELRGRDHQVGAVDQRARKRHPVLWGPSRHTAGQATIPGLTGCWSSSTRTWTWFLPDLNSFEPLQQF